MKLIRCMFPSSVGKPTNIAFEFNSWIITLVILNLILGSNAREMIAPVSIGSTYPKSSLDHHIQAITDRLGVL